MRVAFAFEHDFNQTLARSRQLFSRLLGKRNRVVLVIAISMITGAVLLASLFFQSPENIRISTPHNGEIVYLKTRVAGTAYRLPRRTHVAIAVLCDGRYFVHFDQNIVVKNGLWASDHVVTSDPIDAGKNATVLALVVTDRARRVLLDYLRNPLRAPLCALPEGVKVLHQVQVRIAAATENTVIASSSAGVSCQIAPPDSDRGFLDMISFIGGILGAGAAAAAILKFIRDVRHRNGQAPTNSNG